MPYIHTTTNVTISNEAAESMKAKFGKAIEAFPGKSEGWLMLTFEGDKQMYFKGSPAPCAMVSVSLFGAVNPSAANTMTTLVTNIIATELAIDPARIYVKYDGTENWGWNGGNF